MGIKQLTKLCREPQVPWQPTCQHNNCLLNCRNITSRLLINHLRSSNIPIEKIHWGVGEGPLERVIYNGFPSRSSFLIICLCFFVKSAMNGGSSAAFLSYSLIRCQSSKSCWILGLTCCTGTSSPIKGTSIAALDSEGATTQAAVALGETLTCCVDVWAAANSVSLSTRAVAARA